MRDAAPMTGTVAELWRYPVKSMLGERLASLRCDARGVAGDRWYAIRDAAGKFGSGKNSRRFRQIDGLFELQSAYRGDVVEIRLPGGALLRGDDADVHNALSQVLGQPVELAREAQVSHLDAAPIHVLTTASLRWLQAALPAVGIDARRFRPNVVIEVPGVAPTEQAWIGRRLRIGDAVELQVTDATERCGMIAFAQSELAHAPSVLRYVTQYAGLKFGVYARVVTPGTIQKGDRAALT